MWGIQIPYDMTVVTCALYRIHAVTIIILFCFPTLSQFHQHFTRAHFLYESLFKAKLLAEKSCSKDFHKKTARKMLMKLTPGLWSCGPYFSKVVSSIRLSSNGPLITSLLSYFLSHWFFFVKSGFSKISLFCFHFRRYKLVLTFKLACQNHIHNILTAKA